MSIDFDIYIQSGAATCSEGFVTWLLRVPQAVGPYFSCHAAQSSEGNFQKNRLQNLRNKLSPKTVQYYIFFNIMGFFTFDELEIIFANLWKTVIKIKVTISDFKVQPSVNRLQFSYLSKHLQRRGPPRPAPKCEKRRVRTSCRRLRISLRPECQDTAPQ